MSKYDHLTQDQRNYLLVEKRNLLAMIDEKMQELESIGAIGYAYVKAMEEKHSVQMDIFLLSPIPAKKEISQLKKELEFISRDRNPKNCFEYKNKLDEFESELLKS